MNPSKRTRVWLEVDVLTAARERMAWIFDHYEKVQVSVSGGKDSTVLAFLALQEAELRDRKVEIFWLDQEAEYAASVKAVKSILAHPNAVPRWYQVPIYMTNATSTSEYFLYAWGEGQEWMREKDPLAIHSIDEDYPQRFYEFFPWLEGREPETAYLVGLRAEESLTRFRAVTKHAGRDDILWSTKGPNGSIKFYPLYDWAWSDVWTFIYRFNLPYNEIYDKMFWANYSMYKMRVSNLIHEQSYKCLVDLPKFEPETFDALSQRLSGVATAARYASERLVFSNKKLPSHYESWKQFRDFLLANLPNPEHRERFAKRFANYPENEATYRKQVGQLLVNDYENSRPVDRKEQGRREEMKKKWSTLL